MIKIISYTGQAGTGKTTCLINKIREISSTYKWMDHETLMAITFMHGSRKRLDEKIKSSLIGTEVNFKCSTIDSFCLSILNRFRDYIGISKYITVNTEVSESSYEIYSEISLPLNEIQEHFISLLKNNSVNKYINNSFPFIIVDEFQDCIGNLFQIIKGLSEATNLIVAFDAFQQLNDQEDSEGINWILSNSTELVNLDEGGIKRTSSSKLINTAKSLRLGVKVAGPKIYINTSTVAKGVTSSFIKKNIFYRSKKKSTIAIITPTMCPFVTGAIEDLKNVYKFTKGPNKGIEIGPYHHLVSTYEKTNIDELSMGRFNSDLSKQNLFELRDDKHFILRQCAQIALKRMQLNNKSVCTPLEFKHILLHSIHAYDNFIRKEQTKKVIVTTIHGAKNKEYDFVIVLWPYQVRGDLLKQRKLLYNAVTRAKEDAIILVQHSNMKIEELKKKELFRLIID